MFLPGDPWTEEPGELESMGLQRVRHDWATNGSLHFPLINQRAKLLGPWFSFRTLSPPPPPRLTSANICAFSPTETSLSWPRWPLCLYRHMWLALTAPGSGWPSVSTEWYLSQWPWHPTPVFLPGKSHGWRSLVGYSPWGCKKLDMTEQLHFHT